LLGAGLIGVAVVIGIGRRQSGDQDNTGPSSAGAAPKSTTTTTKAPASTTTSTTSGSTTPARPPSEVHIIVLNGGAPSGEAAHTASGLRIRGYTSQDDANTWSGHKQTGNSVYCHAGFEREGAALATQITGAKLSIPYPSPAPPFTSGTDCVVIVGS